MHDEYSAEPLSTRIKWSVRYVRLQKFNFKLLERSVHRAENGTRMQISMSKEIFPAGLA